MSRPSTSTSPDADTGFTLPVTTTPTVSACDGQRVQQHADLVGSAQTKTVTVEGAGNLDLTVAANTKLTTVDASKATGALTLSLSGHDAAVTVTGGSATTPLSKLRPAPTAVLTCCWW